MLSELGSIRQINSCPWSDEPAKKRCCKLVHLNKFSYIGWVEPINPSSFDEIVQFVRKGNNLEHKYLWKIHLFNLAAEIAS